MQYDFFIKRVQERAGLDSREAAERVSEAVVRTLAERIQGDTANNAAEQLPERLAEWMRRPDGAAAERFGIDDFWDRIAARSGMERADAISAARDVLQELRAALTEGQVDSLWAELPGEFLTPFETPVRGTGGAGEERARGS